MIVKTISDEVTGDTVSKTDRESTMDWISYEIEKSCKDQIATIIQGRMDKTVIKYQMTVEQCSCGCIIMIGRITDINS